MEALFRLNGAVPRDPAVEAWLDSREADLDRLIDNIANDGEGRAA